MNGFPSVFRCFVPQLLHVIILPVFFFTFMLLHRSLGLDVLLGSEWFGVRLTIISCIIFGGVLVSRLLYYYLPLKLNYSLYIFWCLSEIVFSSFFVALYIWLVLGKPMPYFEALAYSFKYLSLTLVFAYVIIALSMRLYEYHEKETHPEQSASRMRFYDHLHNLKIVLMPHTILYISAEENYVNIYYVEQNKVREYVLRSSMRAIDELCQENGLVRCHRSFYINPAHVKVLRKDRDGIMYAELDADDVRHIPVSKTYYERLSNML